MRMSTVIEVAKEFNIKISGLKINIKIESRSYYGSTGSNQTISLARPAFTNEEQLARTLAHEKFHVEQLRSGMGYPTEYDSANIWETAAQAYEDLWWETIGRFFQ
jgi:uncharacterized protein YaeQ